MRRILVALVLVGCREGADPPKVATIPADVAAVDAGPPLALVAAPPEEREEAIDTEGKLPGGKRAIGKAAPGFTLDAALQRGAKVRLLKNKVSVIHFWATWCAPCKASFAVLQKLHEQYADRGVVIDRKSV